jgi:hypothetical protein
MNTTSRILAASALSLLASYTAHAAQGEGANAPEFAPAFVSTASPADVKAGALMPVHITNGGTGFIGVTQSGVSSASVRNEAAMAVRSGQIPRGEASWM